VKNSPKCSPTAFLTKVVHKYYRGGKIAKDFGQLLYVFNRPKGEISLNLVTLNTTICVFRTKVFFCCPHSKQRFHDDENPQKSTLRNVRVHSHIVGTFSATW
jgi:hypothetical protein